MQVLSRRVLGSLRLVVELQETGSPLEGGDGGDGGVAEGRQDAGVCRRARDVECGLPGGKPGRGSWRLGGSGSLGVGLEEAAEHGL